MGLSGGRNRIAGMTTTAITQRNTFAEAEVSDRLERIRDLVRLRNLFVAYKVDDADLRTCDAEIERHRRKIATLTRAAGQALRAA
jgi:hypothetical protein